MKDVIAAIVAASIKKTSRGESAAPIDEHTELVASGILSSLGMISVIDALETELQIMLPAKEIKRQNFESIASISDLARKYAPAPRQASQDAGRV